MAIGGGWGCTGLGGCTTAGGSRPVPEKMRLFSFNESTLNRVIFHITKYTKDSSSVLQVKGNSGIITTRVCSSSAVWCPQNPAFSAPDSPLAEVQLRSTPDRIGVGSQLISKYVITGGFEQL